MPKHKHPISELCMYCVVGMHFMCGRKECCCNKDSTGQPVSLARNVPTNPSDLDLKSFKDAISTGRKRAARLYRIADNQVCDWAWQKNVGGGIEPIVGCSGRSATNIHHGPDKSTLNNGVDNISSICPFCHNLWHHRNDPHYLGERPKDNGTWLPDPADGICHELSEAESATVKEIVGFELSTKERPVDPEEVIQRYDQQRNGTGAKED